MGAETSKPYKPSERSRIVFMKTAEGRRQTIDTKNYINRLKSKRAMTKAIDINRIQTLDLRPDRQQYSV